MGVPGKRKRTLKKRKHEHSAMEKADNVNPGKVPRAKSVAWKDELRARSSTACAGEPFADPAACKFAASADSSQALDCAGNSSLELVPNSAGCARARSGGWDFGFGAGKSALFRLFWRGVSGIWVYRVLF